MRCAICDHTDLRDGKVTVTLQRGVTTVVFREVPARICTNCGEEYVDSATSARLEESLEADIDSRAEVEVRFFPS